ncbi:hypothetical protein ACJJTC_000399 [Scirpophaga incertulas]
MMDWELRWCSAIHPHSSHGLKKKIDFDRDVPCQNLPSTAYNHISTTSASASSNQTVVTEPKGKKNFRMEEPNSIPLAIPVVLFMDSHESHLALELIRKIEDKRSVIVKAFATAGIYRINYNAILDYAVAPSLVTWSESRVNHQPHTEISQDLEENQPCSSKWLQDLIHIPKAKKKKPGKVYAPNPPQSKANETALVIDSNIKF